MWVLPGWAFHSTMSTMALSTAQRRSHVVDKNLWRNCLSVYNSTIKCRPSQSCFTCGMRHHSILHLHRPRVDRNLSLQTSTPSHIQYLFQFVLNHLHVHTLPHRLFRNRHELQLCISHQKSVLADYPGPLKNSPNDFCGNYHLAIWPLLLASFPLHHLHNLLKYRNRLSNAYCLDAAW